MSTKLLGTSPCPLCGKPFLRIELHAHILAESPPIRDGTIKEIKARYPDWVHMHGACPRCWESYRELSQSASPFKILTTPD